ncbi:metalloprotein [Erwinia sp. OLTSP20]|uniref:VOC family protein n=1 Tax=unclassified Erwinia TaxID=2622719 RepID=UPI000C1A61C0|nr:MULTISPECIES: VOC family protein [unclassified Erwinia]PIJ50932.1 metalloprotein [Erwinia sp. OAMSP11]PIJ75941.1 metalloprotein [Erwinia sp. OLSSP12]PIJ83613.1 metalloprotein [Erwinia sp. OLCASP19]PIJ87469.1 metalloprotein [Erwinia sp. OLMTSP26]PIJ89017.1 metalloprotein [Erwinia sp. OLMDSP33]
MKQWYEIEQLQDLVGDLVHFNHALAALAERLSLELSALEVDHIALRCQHESTAERWMHGFLQCGSLLSEKMINGRPVALFELQTPLIIHGSAIYIVELPWPGDKRYRHDGWEHIEYVLRGEPETLGQRAMALFSDSSLTQSGIAFKTSAPKGERECLPNPTLAVTDGEVTIKFHPWSLKEIIASAD